jgi:hypothetical protein
MKHLRNFVDNGELAAYFPAALAAALGGSFFKVIGHEGS